VSGGYGLLEHLQADAASCRDDGDLHQASFRSVGAAGLTRPLGSPG
jgi:hypothetical protein